MLSTFIHFQSFSLGSQQLPNEKHSPLCDRIVFSLILTLLVGLELCTSDVHSSLRSPSIGPRSSATRSRKGLVQQKIVRNFCKLNIESNWIFQFVQLILPFWGVILKWFCRNFARNSRKWKEWVIFADFSAKFCEISFRSYSRKRAREKKERHFVGISRQIREDGNT